MNKQLLLQSSVIILGLSFSITANSAQHFNILVENSTVSTLTNNSFNSAKNKFSKVIAKRYKLTLRKSIKNNDEPQRHRFQRLSPNKLIIDGYDAKGNKKITEIVSDPRVVHSEVFKSNGEVVPSAKQYLRNASLSFSIPGKYKLKTLKIYQLDWDGKKLSRNLLGEISVP